MGWAKGWCAQRVFQMDWDGRDDALGRFGSAGASMWEWPLQWGFVDVI